MRLSVLATLKEAFALWTRHFWFLLLIAFLTWLPEFFLGKTTVHHGHPSPLAGLLSLARLFLEVLIDAAAIAAVLNLLYRKPPENKWTVIVQGIRDYTGRMVGVFIGVFVISVVFFIPFAGMIMLFHIPPAWTILVSAVFVIFIKFALAKPLIVAEGLRAWDALDVSWRMTKNRFAYVLGCYLIFGFFTWLVGFGAGRMPLPAWAGPEVDFLLSLIGTYWIVLPWVMYIRIKEAGGFETMLSPAPKHTVGRGMYSISPRSPTAPENES